MSIGCTLNVISLWIIDITHGINNVILIELCNDKYGMLELWKPTMPHMKWRLRQMEVLMEKHLSRLSNHLTNNRMRSALMFYAQNWFKTLFATSKVGIVSMDVLVRIWDCYFNDGFAILFCFALGILKFHQQRMLKANSIDDVIEILQSKPNPNVINEDAFVKMCLSFKITKQNIDKLQFVSL